MKKKKNKRTLRLPPSGPVFTTSPTPVSTIGFGAAVPTGPPVSPLDTLEYEVGKFRGALEVAGWEAEFARNRIVKFAMTECAVLHARSLCEVFLDPWKRDDDIRLVTLFPDYPNDPKYRNLELAVKSLRDIYGEGAGSPRQTFNELVMHTTSVRGAYGVYDRAMDALRPVILNIVREIESLIGKTFRPIGKFA